ncbi:zeta-crystallin-like [Haliotis rubra]|uniref:zeta-crystallin-like n=1 Tax=Haliotis rubra TaxID=36100 RepID=UPI001EE529E3|nr:zeta-crystallin-like [Haliotis rubra]
MKAVQFHHYGGPEVLQLSTRVAKPSPDENQVLIRVMAAGVNPLDTYIRAGEFGEVALPHTIGWDTAGVVEAVGPGVERFSPGDRVYTMKTVTGGCAEFTVADQNYVGHLDQALSFEEGACVGIPYYTAYKALITLARARPGDNVLIHGASGGVGVAASQLAKAHGMKVNGTAGTDEGISFAKDNGCINVFNHRHRGYVNQLLDTTDGDGYDVIIEMAAHANMDSDVELMRRNGRTIIVGSAGEVKFSPLSTMLKENWFRGISVQTSSPEELVEFRNAIEAGQRSGWVRPKIGSSFPMQKAREAHKLLNSRKGAKGKIVITI